jgi:CelD/BcsL family acetyltransferase involved in cellulose biosynthesis
MIGNSICEVIRTGHENFDFLRGGDSYKAEWAEQSRHTILARLFDNRPASLAVLASFDVEAGLRRIKRSLRPALSN